ncbi:uncharacterized protein TNCV_3260991 [Trichonephila clavipes]|nr:uncharacterized protein TNCV_3260991 [Trichonephila clavipes]
MVKTNTLDHSQNFGTFGEFLRRAVSKVRLLKLQYPDHERDAEQRNPTRVQLATYPAKKQAKEEGACVGLNRSLEQSLKHVGMHYPAER